MERHPDQVPEFTKVNHHQLFFKSPLAVNNCIESMRGPNCQDIENYGAGLIASELISFHELMPLIREKGGAYGAGCRMNESGLINFFSYRDPKIMQTYDNFERSVQSIVDGQFGEYQMQEAKLMAFQKLDKIVEP